MKRYGPILAAVVFGLIPALATIVPAAARVRSSPLAAPLVDIFVNSHQILGGETGNDVALGDLDGDGDVDAFVANHHITAVFVEANQIWCNDGSGEFSAGPTLGTSDGRAVALGDLDGDDDLDALVVGNAPASGGPIQVWLNQFDGQDCEEGNFAAGVSFGTFISFGVALGDVDNDDDLDALVVGNSNQIWLNNGNATFSAGPSFPFQFSSAAALVDLDADGFLDAVISDSANGSSNRVWWNDGNWEPGPGTFTMGDVLPMANLVNSVAVGNLDDDDLPDILFVSSGPEQIYWNNGERDFSAGGAWMQDDNSYDAALGDVDSDGDLDVVVGNITADPNRLWRNDGGRVFTVLQEFGDEIGLYWSRGVALADLNGDGPVDLFEVTTAEDRVWFNSTAPSQVPNEVGWQYQLLETRGVTGLRPAIAFDSNGTPHISYISSYVSGYDPLQGGYTYALAVNHTQRQGGGWRSRVVRSTFDQLENVSIAIDAEGNPHIAYAHFGHLPHYAVWTGTSWRDSVFPAPDVRDADVRHVSLALDANGTPHISYVWFDYYGTQEWQLNYTYWDDGWHVETVDTGDYIFASALGVDTGGNPHVVYNIRVETGETDPLRYARRVGGVWQSETVDVKIRQQSSSLVFDSEGNPHIAYTTYGPYPPKLNHAYRDSAGWQIQTVLEEGDPLDITSLSLDLDSSENPHLAYIAISYSQGTIIKYARRDGTDWQFETLDHNGNTDHNKSFGLAMALDGNDLPHIAYHDPGFDDLRYVTWAPNWQTQPLPENGMVSSLSLDVGDNIPYVGYYNQTGGQVKTAQWDAAWQSNPLAFVSNPVTDLSVEAGTTQRHIVYYDADNTRLLYRNLGPTAVHPPVVDEAGDVGRYNDLVLVGDSDGAARIAYWDSTRRQIKLAVPDPDAFRWLIYENLAGPELDANSGRLSATVLPGGDIGVAYHDAANGDLRLAVWDAQSGSWTDERIDGETTDVGRLNSIQTDGTEGVPVVAYLDETQQVIKFAYKAGNSWQISTVPNTEGEAVSDLSLELGLNSRQRARIAYAADGALSVLVLADGLWHREFIATEGLPADAPIATARDTRIHLAYALDGGGLSYAFRTSALDIDTSAPSPPPPSYFLSDGYYNPLDACQAILELIAAELEPNQIAQEGTRMDAPLPLNAPASDLAIFGAMTTLFAATPEGRHYIDLYVEHGSEMGQLGLNDPALLWDAYGTLQNFLPGLEALLMGRGHEVIATQEMVDDVLDIWQRLAAAGSPALAADINAELAKYNNLQDFVNMSFDEWAERIGVPPPPDTLYLPNVNR